MSSSTSGTQAAGQTMVTFLTQTSSTATPVSEQRVFDYAITREAQTYFEQQMAIIQYALLDGRSWTPSGGVGDQLTPTQIIDTVRAAMSALNAWSRYKYVNASGNQVDTGTYPTSFSSASTMSRYMAQGLDSLIRTLSAAGFNPLEITPNYSQLSAAITTIQSDDLSSTPIYNIRSVLSSAISAAANAVIAGDSSTQSQSIQQLLMIDYVQSGNTILYNEMNQLQTAVNLNQQILSYLNALQDLMNQKDPQHFLMSLQDLNSTSPNYSLFEKETFGDQVLGTSTKFTDADLVKYITLLQIKNQGLNPDDILVKAQYGFITTDAERIELFVALTSYSSGTPILTPGNPTIPADIITKYNFSTYDQALYANFARLQASGASSAEAAFKYGLRDYVQSMMGEIALLSTTSSDFFTGTTGTYALKQFGLLINTNDPVFPDQSLLGPMYYDLYEASISAGAGIPIDINDPYTTREALLLGMCKMITDAGSPDSSEIATLVSYADSTRLPGLVELKREFDVLKTMYQAGINLNPNVTGGALNALLDHLQTYGLLATAETPTPLLGSDSVTVLLNLQKAGLDPRTPAVRSEYNLTSQDVDDYNLILQIQNAGKDPTDATVQAQYGLVVRNSNLTANTAAGTMGQAFIDVISGQFNGTSGFQQIIDNLTALIEKANQYVDPQSGSSVVTELSRVLLDFQGAGSIQTWVTNFTDQNEGTYQSHLNNAITASQALNDTEREQLQQVMFVYQEFYQSASSMLNSLNQLLQSIASNISSQ